MNPEISVIMPVYNSGPFLRQTLESVLAQSFAAFELICVDDCSTDDSEAILREFAQADSRIKILRTAGQSGPGPARNLGFKAAQGEYIAVCDADDLLPPRSLEIRHAAALKHGTEIVAGNMAITDHQGQYYLPPPLNQGACFIQDSVVGPPAELPPLRVPYHHYRFLFRRDFLLQNDIFYVDRLRGEDPVFLATVLCKARLAALCPETVYVYRLSEGAKINSPKKLDDFLGHIPLTMSVYEQAGRRDLAMFYLYFQASEFAALHTFSWYPRALRQRLIGAFLGWFDEYGRANGQTEALDFRPYKIDPAALRAEFALMRRGLICYLAGKTLRRLRSLR